MSGLTFVITARRCRLWCVRWRTPSMRASAFWYFHAYADALRAYKGLREGTERYLTPAR